MVRLCGLCKGGGGEEVSVACHCRGEDAVVVLVCLLARDDVGKQEEEVERRARAAARQEAPRFPFALPALLSNTQRQRRGHGDFVSGTRVRRSHALTLSSWTQTQQHRQQQHHHRRLASTPFRASTHTPHHPPHSGPRLACSRRPYVDPLLLRFVIVVDHRSSFPLLASASQAFIHPHPTSSPCICWAGTFMSCLPHTSISPKPSTTQL